MANLPAEQKPHGPPFTVERYGTFGQSVIAERDWLLEEVERLRGAFEVVNQSHKWLHDEKQRLETALEAIRNELAAGAPGRLINRVNNAWGLANRALPSADDVEAPK